MIIGSGVLFIEKYKKKLVFTLFGKNTGSFGDAGEYTNNTHETPNHNAYIQSRKKTSNLINIKPRQLSQVADQIISADNYLSLVVVIQNLSTKDFHANYVHINRKCKDKEWSANDTMARFDLDHLLNQAVYGNPYANDIYGVRRKIKSRTITLLKNSSAYIKQIASSRYQYPVILSKMKVRSSRMNCLVGTTCYIIDPNNQPALIVGQTQIIQPTVYNLQPLGPSYGVDDKYALYVTPDVTTMSDPFLANCNRIGSGIGSGMGWGGMHITICDFHQYNITLKNYLYIISSAGIKPWNINIKTLRMGRDFKSMHFKSSTLDAISIYLATNNFRNIKGPIYDNTPWHITVNCPVPANINQTLMNLTWSLVFVRSSGGVVQWLDRYALGNLVPNFVVGGKKAHSRKL